VRSLVFKITEGSETIALAVSLLKWVRTIFFWGENFREKTRGGPETAAAEQPKLTTTTTVNRASFHATS